MRLTGWMASAAAMAAMLAAPVQRANAGNEFVGGLVGGLIGGAIGSGLANQQRQRPASRARTRTIYVQPGTRRKEAREIQTALNYFGFDAGITDGVLGARSHAAISSYQAFMGYPATGQLSEYEKSLLLGAYHRGVAGGPEVSRIIANSDQGARALLIAQRDGATGTRPSSHAGLPPEVSQAVDEIASSSDPSAEQLLQRAGFIQLADLNGDGNTDYIIDTALAGSSFWCNAEACKVMVFASTPQGYQRNDLLTHAPTPASFACVGATCQLRAEPLQAAPAPPRTDQGEGLMASGQLPDSGATAGLSLPVFDAAPSQTSLRSHCSKVGLLTSANGGYGTVADFSDAGIVLNEQFCLARDHAMARGEDLMAGVVGADANAIAAQCDSFGRSLSPLIDSVAVKPAQAVLADVGRMVLNSAMTPRQLRTSAQICMASGYRNDRMASALGGALILTALGDKPYAELVGHHLQTGFGVAQNSARALEWYGMALNALDQGATPVFAPGQTDRVDVLRRAVVALGGGQAAPIPASDKSVLPLLEFAQ